MKMKPCPMCSGTGRQQITVMEAGVKNQTEVSCGACHGSKQLADRTDEPWKCEVCGNLFTPFQPDPESIWWSSFCPVCDAKHKAKIEEKEERGESTWTFDVGGPEDVPDFLLDTLSEHEQDRMLGRNRAERRRADREKRRKR